MKKPRSKTFLPDYLLPAHILCFLIHDVLVELLRSGEEQGVFWHRLTIPDDNDREKLDAAADVFEWLEQSGRIEERAELLRTITFPAILSDFLHFIYEALETARKAKLNVAYALIRKPLQENLLLFEIIAADLERFGISMTNDPVALHSHRGGEVDVHANRISKVLGLLGESDRFNAEYIARLRYDKSAEDGFDGVCNKAIHLFTNQKSIQTEPLNINFVFSDWDAKLTQWNYLYSRLPYILSYARCLIEHICATFVKTDISYLADIDRRIAAATLLCAPSIEKKYRCTLIDQFVGQTRSRLYQQCSAAGYSEPRYKDLVRMRAFGSFPGESRLRVIIRNIRYSAAVRRQISFKKGLSF